MADQTTAKKPAFFKGVANEFRKIMWPSQDRLTRETIAVIFFSIVLGLLIALLDWAFQSGLRLVIK